MNRKGILIVEDDPSIREMLMLTLEIEGYEAVCAENGQEGLELLTKIERPCLILLDLMMPVMDGWAFAEALEKDANLAGIPVIVVTAFSNRIGEVKSSRGTIKKPIDIDLLLDVVTKYCC